MRGADWVPIQSQIYTWRHQEIGVLLTSWQAIVFPPPREKGELASVPHATVGSRPSRYWWLWPCLTMLPFPCQSPERIFLRSPPCKYAGILELMPMDTGDPLKLWPPRISHSYASPHSAFSHSTKLLFKCSYWVITAAASIPAEQIWTVFWVCQSLRVSGFQRTQQLPFSRR